MWNLSWTFFGELIIYLSNQLPPFLAQLFAVPTLARCEAPWQLIRCIEFRFNLNKLYPLRHQCLTLSDSRWFDEKINFSHFHWSVFISDGNLTLILVVVSKRIIKKSFRWNLFLFGINLGSKHRLLAVDFNPVLFVIKNKCSKTVRKNVRNLRNSKTFPSILPCYCKHCAWQMTK